MESDHENEDENRRWARLRGKERWRAQDAGWVLTAQRESGQTVTAFARERGLQEKRLFNWRRRLNAAGAAAAKTIAPKQRGTTATLLPVTVRPWSPPAEAHPGAVVSACGVRVEVRDLDARSRVWVAELLGLDAEGRA
jgi:hypothetical protein